MLPSLSIKNFRNLEDLKIASLGRINLIAGKNNTGKSTLLEAISIYASRCNLVLINFLLKERKEYNIPSENNLNSFEASIKTFAALFSGRSVNYFSDGLLSISINDDEFKESQFLAPHFVAIRFVKFIDESSNTESTLGKKIVIPDSDLDQAVDFRIGLKMQSGNSSYILPLDDVRGLRVAYRSITPPDNCQFIRTLDNDREINAKVWDTIILTEKEMHVINALRIIDPNIERLAFIGNEGRERTAVVKLKGDAAVYPIRSMGDGINRILTIILALVNADNGYLLIDEFENGLHYSVQEKLWEIIFKLVQTLNIQVFATTHSNDCIRAFEAVLNENSNYSQGKLIRLDNIKGIIKQTEFDGKELKVAADNFIEIR